jgi:uncharacterized protein
MRARTIDTTNASRTIAVVFAADEAVMPGLKRLAREQRLSGCHFTGIGAFAEVVLGYWDPQTMTYLENRISEQVEVLSLIGNVAQGDGEPRIHAHVIVGKRDGTAHGGHLMSAQVRPTLEIVLTESAGHLRRQIDPETQLPLLVP